MKSVLLKFSKMYFVQLILFLFVNSLFILKYLPRIDINPVWVLSVYIIFIFGLAFMYNKFTGRFSDKTYKYLTWILLGFIIAAIVFILIKVEPYNVRVDRWSAVTFFLDALFRGDYPYGVSTHVSETNFPSPFPVWYVVNLPFYLLGDVGIGLIFFLLFFVIVLQYFFSSYKKTFFFVLLLCVSPAYWWEVAVRSDSLSNVFLVLGFILWYSKKGYSLNRNFYFSLIACGLLASTRLSALLPLAIFFFRDYTKLPWKRIIIFPLGVLFITLLTFLPFILWDTETWIFFSRNPFMSQGGVGNIYVLLAMIVLGIFMSFQWKNTSQYFAISSLFLFIFFLCSQITLIITRGVQGSIFEDSLYDISYFSLLLPYCLAFLADNVWTSRKNVEKK